MIRFVARAILVEFGIPPKIREDVQKVPTDKAKIKKLANYRTAWQILKESISFFISTMSGLEFLERPLRCF